MPHRKPNWKLTNQSQVSLRLGDEHHTLLAKMATAMRTTKTRLATCLLKDAIRREAEKRK